MKLDKQIVQRRVDILQEAGILFRTGVDIGKDMAVDELRREFDAIVLATGASQPRDLPVDGRHLEGILYAVPFLEANTKELLAGGEDVAAGQHPAISAAGKDVIVIGGGDTGTDCVATALRHNCRSLVQFEIMPQPPLKRTLDNPWPQWPRVYKMDYGQEEAAAVYGHDPRQYAIMTKRFAGDEQGRLTAVHTVEVEWKTIGENGRSRRVPVEIPGTEKVWPAQMVLLSMGFLGPENRLLDQLGIKTDARSNVQATYGRFQTNVEGVFAAGDARRGQSLVVWAINEGRGAAREVDRWLMGESDLP